MSSDFFEKKFRNDASRFTSSLGFIGRDRLRPSNLRSRNTPTTSVGSVRNVNKLICDHRGKSHISKSQSKMGAYYRCGSIEHFLKDFPKR